MQPVFIRSPLKFLCLAGHFTLHELDFTAGFCLLFREPILLAYGFPFLPATSVYTFAIGTYSVISNSCPTLSSHSSISSVRLSIVCLIFTPLEQFRILLLGHISNSCVPSLRLSRYLWYRQSRLSLLARHSRLAPLLSSVACSRVIDLK